MPEGAVIGGLLCVLGIGVAVETLIGAVFLRAAGAPYAQLAGGASSPSSVPEPAFGKAMWIAFATFLAQIGLGALIAVVSGGGDSVARTGARTRCGCPAHLLPCQLTHHGSDPVREAADDF